MPAHTSYCNIPIEVVRTVIAVAETGSFTKAGARLGLSQPAISSQIKRIQGLLGGDLFTRTPNGTSVTALGKLALNEARKIIEANDQMLRLGGIADGPPPLRLGVSSLFVREFLRSQNPRSLSGIVIHTENSIGIARSLLDGYIDIAFLLERSESAILADLVINQCEEPFVWVRSKDFVLRPGAPLPLVTWPGDTLMIRALTEAGLGYSIVFNSPDYHTKIAALESGLGLAALPRRVIPPSLVEAKDYFLPRLPTVRLLLCAQKDERTRAAPILRELSPRFFGQTRNPALDQISS
ncbi:LysR family transcriptional regulator [Bradyrhizobium genosp. P]|uniref:LysR family transcriptional regulator n=1 Tax=Bradyrhizobium genosp. P TaxID=83641 RepID=UPI003CE8D273